MEFARGILKAAEEKVEECEGGEEEEEVDRLEMVGVCAPKARARLQATLEHMRSAGRVKRDTPTHRASVAEVCEL